MSPPSSNDPRSPNGRSPDEPVRRDRTRWEHREAEQTPAPAQRSQPAAFDLAPMVTQPFPAFTYPQALPAVPAPAPAPAPAPVSVGRMQGIGTPMQSPSPQQPPLARSRVEEPPTSTPGRAPEAFARTFFAAGHRAVVEERVPERVPEPRPPVPAYPSQPYADPRALERSPALHVREPAPQPSSAQRARVDEPRSSTPREPMPAYEPPVNPQQGVTTSLDVHDMMMKYPVPMPAVRGEEDSSSAWSAPVVESPRSSARSLPEEARAATPQSQVRVRPYPSPPARGGREREDERALRKVAISPLEHDEIDVNRVLGRANMKGLLLGCAVAVSLGLLGLSLYVKHAREAEAGQLAAASESVAAALPAEPVASPAGAQLEPQREEEEQEQEEEGPPPTGGAPAEEPEVPTHAPRARAEQPEVPAPAPRTRRTEPAARELVPDADKPPAVHASAGGVSAGSAAGLYINGQYKEALAEYQLLARAYPKQPVYRELARILRRKLIETCMRTQPNRREQCKTM